MHSRLPKLLWRSSTALWRRAGAAKAGGTDEKIWPAISAPTGWFPRSNGIATCARPAWSCTSTMFPVANASATAVAGRLRRQTKGAGNGRNPRQLLSGPDSTPAADCDTDPAGCRRVSVKATASLMVRPYWPRISLQLSGSSSSALYWPRSRSLNAVSADMSGLLGRNSGQPVLNGQPRGSFRPSIRSLLPRSATCGPLKRVGARLRMLEYCESGRCTGGASSIGRR